MAPSRSCTVSPVSNAVTPRSPHKVSCGIVTASIVRGAVNASAAVNTDAARAVSNLPAFGRGCAQAGNVSISIRQSSAPLIAVRTGAPLWEQACDQLGLHPRLA